MGLSFGNETAEAGVFNFKKYEFDAALKTIKLVIDRWIARAVPAILNTILSNL